jgi:hypothetical protein
MDTVLSEIKKFRSLEEAKEAKEEALTVWILFITIQVDPHILAQSGHRH